VIFTLVFCCIEAIESDRRMWGVCIHKGEDCCIENNLGLLLSNTPMVCIDICSFSLLVDSPISERANEKYETETLYWFGILCTACSSSRPAVSTPITLPKIPTSSHRTKCCCLKKFKSIEWGIGTGTPADIEAGEPAGRPPGAGNRSCKHDTCSYLHRISDFVGSKIAFRHTARIFPHGIILPKIQKSR